jgi:hypothetical protein
MLSALRLPLCVVFVVVANAAAQDLPAIKPDTTFPAELRHTIHSSSVKVGDPVEFRTVEAVLIGNGVVVPDGASLLGEIDKVQPRSVSSSEASVSVRINKLQWGNHSIPLNLVVSKVFYARAGYVNEPRPGVKPTFLEGIQIVAHLSDVAFTEFSSSKKEVVLRNGVLLLFRQIDPEKFFYTPQLALSR